MLKYIFLFIFLYVDIFANTSVPSWFKNDNKRIEVYTYGKTLSEAKLKAKIKFQNELNITNININDFEIIKKEFFELKYFIKSLYVNEDIYTQVRNKLKTNAFKIEDQNNPFLINTNFFKKLYNEFMYYPKIDLIDNYLYFDNEKFLIKSYEIKDFISNFEDKNINIDILDSIKEHENFFIDVSSSYDGYTTLAQLYNGKIYLLFKNKKINGTLIFPNFKISDGFKISLQNNKTNDVITTIVSICKEKKDLNLFKMYYEDDNSNNLKFNDFINKMLNCKISSKQTKIIK